MSGTEYLAICDAQDRAIGLAPRPVIHAQGLLHRAIHIAVVNADGDLYLQRRGPDKDEFPDCWAISVGGHVDAGEEPLATAHRELAEEINLDGELREIGRLDPGPENGWEFVTLFEHRATREPRPDGDEVTEGRWFAPDEISRLIADENFPTAPSLKSGFELWAMCRNDGGKTEK